MARGLEPDQCYYIHQEQLVREIDEIDFSQDPPPDLVIEIDITSSSINRLNLYAALGVPEVWRYDGRAITIYQLEDKKYQVYEHSPTFPFLVSTEIIRFLELRKTMGENSMIRSFREWVRSQHQIIKVAE